MADPNFDAMPDEFGQGTLQGHTIDENPAVKPISIFGHCQATLIGSDGTFFMSGLIIILLNYYGAARLCSGCGSRFWGPAVAYLAAKAIVTIGRFTDVIALCIASAISHRKLKANLKSRLFCAVRRFSNDGVNHTLMKNSLKET